MSVIDLRDDQVDAVITEALARGFFETGPDGNLASDIEDRRKSAVDLVRQATLSFAAGNDSPGVIALLKISEVGSGPVSSPPEGDTMAATDAEQLTQQPDEMLPKLLQTLSTFEQTDDVKANVALIQAEMAKRGLAAPEVSDGNGAAAPAPEPETPAVELSATSREDLEDGLTFKMMKAHGVDPSEVGGLSDDELKQIIANPTGPPEETPQSEIPQEEAVPPTDPGDVIQTTRMVTEQPEPESAPVATPTIAEQNGATADSEREELESQITGPILKVYGRGRKDVPEIGDAELEFMIANPDGRVAQEALDAARALDRGESVNANDLEPEDDADSTPTIAEQKRAAKTEAATPSSEPEPAAEPDAAFAPAQPEAAAEVPPTSAPSSASSAPATAVESSAPPAASGGRVTRKSALNRELPENPAQSIIDKENFPIPPSIGETPPRLPFDLSTCSDAEVASYHAQFHACSVRMNYVVGLWESELRDAVKLRKAREVQVANDLPKTEGRSKITDAQREALVQADEEVVQLRDEEHETEKVLRQLKILQSNYSSDVAACSRQDNMRHREADGARA